MCCLLVSGFLTEITQQIHSLRASGVISSHFARVTGSEMRTFRKSAGTLCTAPGEIAFLVMDFILHRYAISLGSPAAVLDILGSPLVAQIGSNGGPSSGDCGQSGQFARQSFDLLTVYDDCLKRKLQHGEGYS
jgi:hypothetical protein